MSTLVLTISSENEEMTEYTDACRTRLSVALLERGKVGAYVSRRMRPHEKKYLTHDLQLAAIVLALKV